MRLHPPVSEQDILEWLKTQAVASNEAATDLPDLEEALQTTAEAMAAIGAVVLPDDIEPHFP